MKIEHPRKVPEVVIAELPDGREFVIKGEEMLQAIVATNEPTQCEVLRIQVKDESEIAALNARYR
jgi:hypothetical protein